MSTPTLLDALTVRGVLINVSVRYWRARKKLTADDLGLSADQVDDRLISLGHKKLLPRDALHDLALIESRTHAFVAENSFPFLGGIAHYVPNEKLDEVQQRLHVLRTEFDDAESRFRERYGELRTVGLERWRDAADSLVGDPERLLAKISDAFPPVAAMDRYFSYTISMFQLSVPDVPQADLIEAGTQQELLETRRRAAFEARSAIQSSCQDFIADSVATLRQETAVLCSQMLGTISSTDNVHQKTLNRLLKFIDQFKQLNFANDSEMAEQLEAVRKEFLARTAEEYRSSDFARDQLVNGLSKLRDKASDLARQDAFELVNSFGQMGRRKFTLAA